MVALRQPVSCADSNVVPGQEGYALSCFSGSEPKKLTVKILGILHGSVAGSDQILAEIHGDPVDSAGIIAGMSGSPVYIDNRLIGAIAFSFPFSKKPICGITPIESMRKLTEMRMKHSARKKHTSTSIFRRENQQSTVSGSLCAPIGFPLICPGFSGRFFDLMNSSKFALQTQDRFHPVTGGKIPTEDMNTGGDAVLQPGSPVGCVFLDGDISMAVTGTVTDVQGNNFLAFGHPLFGLGACNIPVAAVDVVTSIPSLSHSFRIGNIGRLIGTLYADSDQGVAGMLGPAPTMIPIEITVDTPYGSTNRYSLRVVDDENFIAYFTGLGLASILEQNGPASGDFAYRIDLDLFIENQEKVSLHRAIGYVENPFSDVFDVLRPVETIIQNPIQQVSLERINIHVGITERIKLLALESARVIQTRVKPGETVQIALTTRAVRGEITHRTVSLEVPRNIPSGVYDLAIMDSQAYQRYKSDKQLASVFYRSIDAYLSEFRDTDAGNALHILLLHGDRQIDVGHGILPNTLPTLESVSAMPPARSSRFAVAHSMAVFPDQITGHDEFQIRIIPGHRQNSRR